jgi:hypothetical protein
MSRRYLALILLPSFALLGCAANQARTISEPGTEQAAASALSASRELAVVAVDTQELRQQPAACLRIRPQVSITQRSGGCYPLARVAHYEQPPMPALPDLERISRENALIQERQQMQERLWELWTR